MKDDIDELPDWPDDTIEVPRAGRRFDSCPNIPPT
jgi:hypothetical protein